MMPGALVRQVIKTSLSVRARFGWLLRPSRRVGFSRARQGGRALRSLGSSLQRLYCPAPVLARVARPRHAGSCGARYAAPRWRARPCRGSLFVRHSGVGLRPGFLSPCGTFAKSNFSSFLMTSAYHNFPRKIAF